MHGTFDTVEAAEAKIAELKAGGDTRTLVVFPDLDNDGKYTIAAQMKAFTGADFIKKLKQEAGQ